MSKEVYIFEGKTTNEAIEKGLKELKISKSKADIRVLDQEDKRSFFSILTPRIVKVEIKLKEGKEETKETKKATKTEKTDVDKNQIVKTLKEFLEEFLMKLPTKDLKYEIKEENKDFYINIEGEDTGYLIGYRGEVLNSLQTIISNIVTQKTTQNVKVMLNISGYREKREKDLQILATKIANSVIKTKKSITLEPMSAYERKIIHTKLQENDNVETFSVGEEPYRKIIVKLK